MYGIVKYAKTAVAYYWWIIIDAIKYCTLWDNIIVAGKEETRLLTLNRIRTDDGILIISEARSEDSGNYVCYARNGVGDTLTKKVTLAVIGELENKLLNFQYK